MRSRTPLSLPAATAASWMAAAAGALAMVLPAAACSRTPPHGAPEPPGVVSASAETDAAVTLFERRVAEDPRDAPSARILAELLLRRCRETGDASDAARAEAAARLAIARDPRDGTAAARLASALLRQGRPNEADAALTEALRASVPPSAALEAAFDVAVARGDLPAARALSERLLTRNEEPGTLSRLARIAADDGDLSRATELWLRAAREAADLGAMPDEIAGYHVALGEALVRADRRTDARRAFEDALAAWPRDLAARRALTAVPE